MIDVRHEQAAAFMGQAYSRLRKTCRLHGRQRPGRDQPDHWCRQRADRLRPVIAIGGSSPISQFGRQVFQEIDQAELMSGS